MKIWGRTSSANVQKVLWCCAELGLDYERVDWGGKFGGNDDAAYRSLNPNGLVPTLEDGDLVLWESNTIVRYLTDEYGAGKIIPTSNQGRAEASRWMDWQVSTVNRAMVPVFQGLIRIPEPERDLDAIERARLDACGIWSILDKQLSDREFVVGGDFTVGDIPPGVWVNRWFQLPIERPELPNLQRWYERLGERPGYRNHVMIPMS